MANPITITASNSSDVTLTLSDHGNTNVDPGESVLWHIGQNSGVESITSITKKASSVDIFSTAPHQDGSGNSPNWKGVVSLTSAGSEYYYSIFWLAADGSGTHEFDPKISVNS